MKNSGEVKRLRELARKTLDFLGYKDAVVEVNIVESEVLKSLNRRFRGKNSTTNILSFTSPPDFPHPHKKLPRFLGEIYLDPAYIRRQKENIDYLLIHGLLHLLGFDHKRYDDRIKMARLEKRLLRWQKIKS